MLDPPSNLGVSSASVALVYFILKVNLSEKQQNEAPSNYEWKPYDVGHAYSIASYRCVSLQL